MARTLALQRDVNNHIGEIQLEIDHCLEFVKMHEGFRRHSQTVLIRGLAWKIFASLRQRENRPRTLGFFLECDGVESNPRWYCTAAAILRLHSQTPGIADFKKRTTHTFNADENDWGFAEFINCEALVDPRNGFIKDDTVKLSIRVFADKPIEVANEITSSPTHVQIENSTQHSMDQLKGEIGILVNKNAKLTFELEKIHDENTCLICYDHQRDILILPCSHLACCNACAPDVLRLNQCCVCRTKIGGFLKIYKT